MAADVRGDARSWDARGLSCRRRGDKLRGLPSYVRLVSAPLPQPPPGVDFARLRQVLLRCVRRTAPSWMHDSVEDIVQGALTRMAAKLSDGTGAGDREYPTSYLMKMANHAVIDEIRKVRRRREVIYPESEDGSEALSEKPRGPRDIAIGTAIGECMTHLN